MTVQLVSESSSRSLRQSIDAREVGRQMAVKCRFSSPPLR
jgi:hypothetical protein